MEFDIKIKGIKELAKQLHPDVMARVVTATVNDLAKTVKVQTVKQIRESYNISSERLKEGIKIMRRATQKNPIAVLEYFDERVPGIHHYKLSIKKRAKDKRPALSVTIRKKGTRKRIAGFILPGKIDTRLGVPLVFSRGKYEGGQFKPDPKGKIVKLLGPTIKGMFRASGGYELANEVVQREMAGKFERNLHRELYRAKMRGGGE